MKVGKALWKGSISFGLVNIGIELFTAVKEHVIGFKLLHGKCLNPISYKKWCDHCEQEIEWQEIVRGLKLQDGSYFILTSENLKKLKPEKTDSINLAEFVDSNSIDPIYYNHHYYVVPSKKSDKAYFLFCAALKKAGKIAVGQFVLRDKEYVCAIQPYMNGLSLTTLNYAYEVQEISQFYDLPAHEKISESELKLALLLMSKLYKKKFDISKFKDSFAQKLLQKIKEKKTSKKVVKKVEEPKRVSPGLMQALRASLESVDHVAAKASRR